MQSMIFLFSMYMLTAVLSFLSRGISGYILIFLLSLLSVVLTKSFLGPWYLSLYMIITVIITFAAIKIGKRLLGVSKEDTDGVIRKKKAVVSILSNENKVKNAKRHVLYERSRNIGNLYENIKNVSVLLRKREIISEFGKFLNNNFSFIFCKVVFFDFENEDVNAYVYTIKKDDNAVFFEEKKMAVFSSMIERLKHRKSFFTIGSSEPGFYDFAEGSNCSVIEAIPFYIEKKMTSIIYIADLPQKQKDNFFIVASQTAMSLNRSNLYERVEHLSFVDSLTGIYLRRYFDQRAQEEVLRAQKHNLTVAILMIDIDHFKQCNDTYGHMVGDIVLKEVALRIQHNIREIDLISRYGGEEFTVLLPEVNKDLVFQIAERIRNTVEEKEIVAYDEKVNITVSIGASLFPKDGKTLATLINKADTAMYMSKNAGRNKVTMID
ncbi:MAG: GGDEF domain-containing protein [Candidatus Omnitrophica bacterium]|nr:GGDEF domain-containing protein [Candidatus Omnitrophota bacterium]